MPPAGRLGDCAMVPFDAHGCPACPHPCTGPAILGSPNVFVNSLPALRVTDIGVHAACCFSNLWTARTGCPKVLINGLDAHRKTDDTDHCGGPGTLIQGSPNVIIDCGSGGGGGPVSARSRERQARAVRQPPDGERSLVPALTDPRRDRLYLDSRGQQGPLPGRSLRRDTQEPDALARDRRGCAAVVPRRRATGDPADAADRVRKPSPRQGLPRRGNRPRGPCALRDAGHDGRLDARLARWRGTLTLLDVAELLELLLELRL